MAPCCPRGPRQHARESSAASHGARLTRAAFHSPPPRARPPPTPTLVAALAPARSSPWSSRARPHLRHGRAVRRGGGNAGRVRVERGARAHGAARDLRSRGDAAAARPARRRRFAAPWSNATHTTRSSPPHTHGASDPHVQARTLYRSRVEIRSRSRGRNKYLPRAERDQRRRIASTASVNNQRRRAASTSSHARARLALPRARPVLLLVHSQDVALRARKPTTKHTPIHVASESAPRRRDRTRRQAHSPRSRRGRAAGPTRTFT